MGTILTLALKDLRILVRDKANLFWVMFFPLLIALFFGTIFSGSGGSISGMNIAVVDEDNSEYSAEYIGEIKGMETLNVSEMSSDSAFSLVRRGKQSAVVVLKKGFGEHHGMFTDSALLEIGIDPVRRMEAGYLQGLLTQANFILLQKKYTTLDGIQSEIDKITNDESMWAGVDSTDRALGKKLLGTVKDITAYNLKKTASDSTDSDGTGKQRNFDLFPVDVKAVTNDANGPRSPFEVTFPSALLWALIGVSATFAVSLVKERTAGTMLRLRLAPISRGHILAGKGMAAFIASVTICLILLAIGNLMFGVRIADPLILLIGVVSAALCFVGVTMLISVMGKTEESVGGASWGILLVAAMTGGGMIPVMFMPGWLLTISNFSPVKWGILAIEGGIWRNFSYSEMLLPVGMLLGIGAVCFIVGVTILTRTDA